MAFYNVSNIAMGGHGGGKAAGQSGVMGQPVELVFRW